MAIKEINVETGFTSDEALAYVKQVLSNKAQELNLYTQKLKVLNPLSIMEKGFSVVYKDEEIIKSKTLLNPNDVIDILFSDGKVKAKVIEGDTDE